MEALPVQAQARVSCKTADLLGKCTMHAADSCDTLPIAFPRSASTCSYVRVIASSRRSIFFLPLADPYSIPAKTWMAFMLAVDLIYTGEEWFNVLPQIASRHHS
eukprot:1158839-Pelagomonas_calceolata.AAC.1